MAGTFEQAVVRFTAGCRVARRGLRRQRTASTIPGWGTEFLAPARGLLSADQWEEERRAGRSFNVQEALAQAGVTG